MLWLAIGFFLAITVAAAATVRSRTRGGFYDHDVYGMDARAHRRYAAVSFVFAAFFGVAYALHLVGAGIAALALYALIAVLYAASFLRGATETDE